MDFDPWVRKIPWSRKWQPTPVFLPGKFHGQRNLVGCCLWGCKESDTAEQACARNSRASVSPSLGKAKARRNCFHIHILDLGTSFIWKFTLAQEKGLLFKLNSPDLTLKFMLLSATNCNLQTSNPKSN